jgi:hypothetical protein
VWQFDKKAYSAIGGKGDGNAALALRPFDPAVPLLDVSDAMLTSNADLEWCAFPSGATAGATALMNTVRIPPSGHIAQSG